MKTIPLSKGKFAIVDDEDFKWLNQWNWQLSWNGYAIRQQHIRLGVNKYSHKCVRMHRLINRTPIGGITDHINRNKLDNRKANLRNANKSLNSINRDKQPNNKSGTRGVYWDKFNDKWRAELKINGVKKSLGRFLDKDDAILARKEGERIYYAI
jgi:hypothetical protein